VLGSRYRGDDAVGPLVGDRLRERGITVLDCGDEPTRLIEPLAGLDVAVVVDAVRSGAAPGTVHRVEAVDGALPRDLGLASSHAFGVADAIELAHALGRAPRRVVVIGIEGRAFGMGDPVTPEVEAALDRAADVVDEVLGGGT
jgi:hydrogenase maturation protease